MVHKLRLYSTKASHTKQTIDRIIRVDHAGELGADRIYAGQMAVLGGCVDMDILGLPVHLYLRIIFEHNLHF